MSRVLLTGASGFVGRSLTKRLLDDGHDVHALDMHAQAGQPAEGVMWHTVDLLDGAAVTRLMGELRPERMVHLAWYVTHQSFWFAPENLEWVQASLGLLRAFGASGGRRAVLVGSCAEYAWGGPGDLDEHSTPLEPRTLYGVCKDGLRRVAEAYADQVGFELAWGRLFFLYGPGEQPTRLVPAVIRALLARERIATSSGEQVRDFLHVRDVAGGLATLLASELTGPVNIGSGEATSVAEVLDIIGELTGGTELIDRGARPTDPSEPHRIVADVGRLVGEAGFRPALSLRGGLAETVEWWREQAAPR